MIKALMKVIRKVITRGVIDALSGCESHGTLSVYVCTLSWKEKLIQGYHDSEEDKHLLGVLALSGSHPGGFSLVDGVIKFKG
jgi:hypothetical protein